MAVTRPIQYTHTRGLLVLVQPEDDDAADDEGGGVSDDEAAAMLRWVDQGNSLLLLGKKATALHRALDVVPTEDASADKQTYVHVALDPDLDPSFGYLRDIHSLSVGSRSTLPPRAGAMPLWWIGKDQDRAAGALVLRRGQGRVIVVADPSLATYSGLWDRKDGQEVLRDDNVLFLANVAALHARDGKVYFDEYHHGFQSGGGLWGYLGYHGQQLLPGAVAPRRGGGSVDGGGAAGSGGADAAYFGSRRGGLRLGFGPPLPAGRCPAAAGAHAGPRLPRRPDAAPALAAQRPAGGGFGGLAACTIRGRRASACKTCCAAWRNCARGR